jgi:serine/threonine-protein kinase
MSRESASEVGNLLADKWRILRRLGAGGMGTVYEASHRNGKRVAIKILHADLRSNEQARARFVREGYIANRVNHSGVPSVLDDGETADRGAYLVMDLLHGETLESRTRATGENRAKLSLPEIRQITLTVLDVLSAAHDQGIVHRDIKPSNVFLSTDGSVKLLDFGIARMRGVPEQDSVTLSHGGVALGTPAFMAPEQARGHWDEVDCRTDIWSVGALMFALLTGRNVHQGQSSNELMILSATSPAPPIASIRSDLPPDFARIVDRALSFHRELRWPDARAMHSAIRSLQVQPQPDEFAAITHNSCAIESPRASTTSDQLNAVVEGPRKLPRSAWLPLAAAALCCFFTVVWLAGSRAVQAATPAHGAVTATSQAAIPADHAVTATSQAAIPAGRAVMPSGSPQDVQPAEPATSPAPTDAAVLAASPSNAIVRAPRGVDLARKSGGRVAAPSHAALAENPTPLRPGSSATAAPDRPVPALTPAGSGADDWLERRK